MRFLKLLFFLVVFLSSSFSFANFTREEFDAGRTEKYGYSFYNGEPVYLAAIYGGSNGVTAFEVRGYQRLQTGVNFEDFGFVPTELEYYRSWDSVSRCFILFVTPSEASTSIGSLQRFAVDNLRSRLSMSPDNVFSYFDYFADNIIIWVIAGTGLAVFLYTFRLCFYGFGKTVNKVSSNKDFKVSGGVSSVSVDKRFSRSSKSHWQSFSDMRYRSNFRRIYKFAADMPADAERSSLALYNDYVSLKDADRDSLNSALIDYRKSHNYVGSNEYFLSVVESEFVEDEGIDYE